LTHTVVYSGSNNFSDFPLGQLP